MKDDCLTEDQMRRLRAILTHEGLEAFLPYAEQAAAEAKISAARRLLWKTYRQMFVALVGLIVAVATFWEKTLGGVKAFLQWAVGQ